MYPGLNQLNPPSTPFEPPDKPPAPISRKTIGSATYASEGPKIDSANIALALEAKGLGPDAARPILRQVFSGRSICLKVSRVDTGRFEPIQTICKHRPLSAMPR